MKIFTLLSAITPSAVRREEEELSRYSATGMNSGSKSRAAIEKKDGKNEFSPGIEISPSQRELVSLILNIGGIK